MTVIFMTKKTSGMQIKGELHTEEGVKQIIDDNKALILYHHENWQTLLDKKLYEIIKIY